MWRVRGIGAGIEKLLSLGAYPDVSLKRAREKRDQARRLISNGVDASAETFEAIGRMVGASREAHGSYHPTEGDLVARTDMR